MADGLEIVATGVDDVSPVFDRIAQGISIAFGEKLLDAVGATFSFITDQLGDFITEASKGQDVETLFNATIEKSPLNQYKNQLLAVADAKSKVTKFSYDEIIAADQVLAKYQNLGPAITDVSKLTLDFATFTGMDATSAATQLGKGLEDIAGGSLSLLARTRLLTAEERDQAVAMAKNGDAAGAQAYVIKILDDATGGMAEKMGQTYSGQIKIFQDQLERLKETVGTPILDLITPWLTKFADILSGIDFSKGLAGVDWGKLWDQFRGVIIDGLQSIDNWLTSNPEAITHFTESFFIAIDNGMAGASQDKVPGLVGDIINKIADQITKVNWGPIATNIWAQLNAQPTSPWENLGHKWGDATRIAMADAAAKTVIIWQQNFVQLEQIVAGLDALIVNNINNAATRIQNSISSAFNGAVSTVRDDVNQIISWINRIPAIHIPIISGSIPGHASGGDASGLTWVGEQGPELVNLPSGSHVYSNSQSQAMSGIDYSKMPQIDYKKLARAMVTALQTSGLAKA